MHPQSARTYTLRLAFWEHDMKPLEILHHLHEKARSSCAFMESVHAQRAQDDPSSWELQNTPAIYNVILLPDDRIEVFQTIPHAITKSRLETSSAHTHLQNHAEAQNCNMELDERSAEIVSILKEILGHAQGGQEAILFPYLSLRVFPKNVTTHSTLMLGFSQKTAGHMAFRPQRPGVNLLENIPLLTALIHHMPRLSLSQSHHPLWSITASCLTHPVNMHAANEKDLLMLTALLQSNALLRADLTKDLTLMRHDTTPLSAHLQAILDI